MSNTTRFTKLLGECRRQMNGAVAGSMRYYGADYGLNYGVSLPTVRALAASEGVDHAFATYLYLQQVREIRLAAYHIADPKQITSSNLKFWAEGIINSELAEEAAFALFSKVNCVAEWLLSSNELLIYTALLSISKSHSVKFDELSIHIKPIVARESTMLTSAIITLLDSYYREQENRSSIMALMNQLPQSKTSEYISSELAWRCDL